MSSRGNEIVMTPPKFIIIVVEGWYLQRHNIFKYAGNEMETQDYILSGKWVYHIYVSTLVLKTSHFLRTQLYMIVYN